MVRPHKKRNIVFSPEAVYYKPAGIPLRELEEEQLELDEVEALRLCDYKDLSQKESAKKMNISQSTFNRILSKARKKVSTAIVEGKAIKVKVK